MATTVELSGKHGLVLATVAGASLLHNAWMGMKVGEARKKYKVTFPAAYAPPGHEHEKEFNCVQRAHQNSLENLPSFYAWLLTAGLRYPVAASSAGCIYLLGRVLYFQGYSTGEPKRRSRGFPAMTIGGGALLSMVAVWSAQLLSQLVQQS